MSKCKVTGKKLVIQLGRTDTQIVAMNGSTILYGKTYETPVGAVEDGMIRNQEAVRELLKGAMKEPEFKGIRQVVFTLCTSQVISEVVATPDLPASRLEKLLQANVDMYFPVDMHDYKLVWQVIGPKRSESGAKEVNVQLWAMPVNMVTRYYQVANACGLSVAAIDYIGNSIAGAIGASFAENAKGGKTRKKLDLNAEISFGKKKAEPGPAAEENLVRENPATQLHLLLEKDILGMTFVQNGQVMVQRFVRCGSDPTYQFGELAMMLEYFRAMDIGRGSSIEGIVSGALAEESGIVQELEDIMGISLFRFNASYDLGWFLCVGAACTALDFGIPALNKPGTVRREFQSQLWQYGLLLAGGLAVLFVVLTLLTSRLGWNADISSLKNTQQMLTIQNSKVAGYADNYYDYESKYNAYSNDWETVFASLQTYNDNLVLVMEELEAVMPEKVNVVNMQIGATGLNVAFACDTKEEAAYLITALDKLEYAELIRPVSDLLGGGGGAAKTYGSGTKKEAAPTEGAAKNYGPTAKQEAFLRQAFSWNSGQLDALKSAYGKTPATNSASMATSDMQKRSDAIGELLTTDPYAVLAFKELMLADFNEDTQILVYHILGDLMSLGFNIPSDYDGAMEYMAKLLPVLTRDDILPKTEALLLENQVLCDADSKCDGGANCKHDYIGKAYLHLLEVQAGERTEENFPYLNVTAIEKDIQNGGAKAGDDTVNAVLNDQFYKEPEPTVPEETTPDETKPDETIPDVTEPQVTYDETKDALKKLLSMENVGDPILAGRVKEYIRTGEIVNAPEEADALDAYVQSGALDTQFRKLLEEWLNPGEEGFDGLSHVVDMLTNYDKKIGNTVLNARLKTIEEQMETNSTEPTEETTEPTEETTEPTEETTAPTEETTEPTETKPSESIPDESKPDEEDKSIEDQIKDMLATEFMEYWTNGPKDGDKLDKVFDDYLKSEEGKFELSGLTVGDVLPEDKIPEGISPDMVIPESMLPEGLDKTVDEKAGQAVSLSLYMYLTYGLEKDKHYSRVVDTYFANGGDSNYKYVDEKLDNLIEAGTVDTQLANIVVAYRKAGKTGLDNLDKLIKSYEDKKINSTGIWPLDKALKRIYFELLTATTKQAAQQASAGIAKDTHLYFSVYLNYKEDLRNAELNRKGLDYEKKIEKLEVGE